MRILSLFRDLYLYTYYYAAVVKKSEGKDLDPVIGFIGVCTGQPKLDTFS